MVSSSVGMTLEDVVEALQRMARDYAADDDEFKTLRSALPESFPF